LDGQQVVVEVVEVVDVVLVVLVVVVVVVPTHGVTHRWHASDPPSSAGGRQGHVCGHPSAILTWMTPFHDQTHCPA
jgi:hypothetical protein